MPNLTTVTLPANLTGIPKDAFAGSAKLATVNFGTDTSNGGGGSSPAGRAVIGDTNAITLPTGITRIDANAFYGTIATTVDLSKITAANFTTIENSVFKDMTKLATVKLPATITAIRDNAFQNDANLVKLSTETPASSGAQTREGDDTTATFGSKLTSIGNQAFYGTGFTTVDLSAAKGTPASAGGGAPTTLTVGANAFTNMAELTEVKLPANADINPTYFGNPTTAGTTPKLKTITYVGETTETPATATIGDANISSTNFSKIKNSTIEIKSSVRDSGITFTGGVFNENSTMTTLKLSVTQTNGNAPL